MSSGKNMIEQTLLKTHKKKIVKNNNNPEIREVPHEIPYIIYERRQ